MIAGISRTTPTRGDSFRMTLGRMTATDRVDAGQWLNQYLTGRFPRYGDRGEQDPGIIARVGGHAIIARTTPARINELGCGARGRQTASRSRDSAPKGVRSPRVNVSISLTQDQLLDQLAHDRGRSRSELVREALDAYLSHAV